jgi:hypothetical protein
MQLHLINGFLGSGKTSAIIATVFFKRLPARSLNQPWAWAIPLMGYFAILLAWLVGRYRQDQLSGYASLALWGMSAFGLLFSIYLTFLEPFVIGATCAWCVSSAILMTALFWLSLAPAKTALSYLFVEKNHALERSSSQRAR